MTGRSNLAYQSLPEQQPKEQVIGKVESRRVEAIKPAAFIAMLLVITGLLVFLIFSMVRLNEVTSQINGMEAQLREQQSEQVRLSAQLESEMSLTSVENYAQQNLGLTKLNPNQVSYITLDSGNRIELPQQEEASWWDEVTQDISDFFAYLFQ